MSGDERAFKDHFSDRSDDYARFRPQYPSQLFDAIREVVPRPSLALDCATGNGQLALDLADFCERVVATDASAEQIANAIPHPNVDYRVARAEATGLLPDSVELLTVGQALHWFDFSAFFAEAERVTQAGALLLCASYATCTVDDSVDAAVRHLYVDLLDPFWPPERTLVEQGYAGIDLPGRALDFPALAMTAEWTVDDMLGYLRTWSATKRFVAANGTDPVLQIETPLRDAWGDTPRSVRWPLTIRASRL